MNERTNNTLNLESLINTKLFCDYLEERKKLMAMNSDSAADEEGLKKQALIVNDKADKFVGDGKGATEIYDIFRVHLIRTKEGKTCAYRGWEIDVDVRRIRLENKSE